MFNFEDSLLVGPLLCLLMLAIACCRIGLSVRERACGLKTLTSKKVRSYRPPQSPFAAMSSLAPSCVLADAPERCLPVMDCRCGSAWHYSLRVIPRIYAEISRGQYFAVEIFRGYCPILDFLASAGGQSNPEIKILRGYYFSTAKITTSTYRLLSHAHD